MLIPNPFKIIHIIPKPNRTRLNVSDFADMLTQKIAHLGQISDLNPQGNKYDYKYVENEL